MEELEEMAEKIYEKFSSGIELNREEIQFIKDHLLELKNAGIESEFLCSFILAVRDESYIKECIDNDEFDFTHDDVVSLMKRNNRF